MLAGFRAIDSDSKSRVPPNQQEEQRLVRKLLVAAVVAALAVVGFAVMATADEGQDKTEWTFTFNKDAGGKLQKAVNKPAASDSLIIPAKVNDQGTADESDDVYTPPEKSTIVFPQGSVVDTAALKRCGLSASDVGRGEECPGKTRLGDGAAVSVVGGTPVGSNGQRQGGSKVNATIEAFNQKSGILFVVQPCGSGTGPTTGKDCEPAGSPIVLEGKWSKVNTKPTLVVPTPPGLVAIGVTIVRFQLTTDKHTKTKTVTVNGQRRQVTVSFVTTPEECGGNWKSQAKEEYVDGSSQTIKDSQKCNRP